MVPKKKIAKYIEKGRFRRGEKLTMEEKLRRFADSMKPPPEIKKDIGFMNDWLYWKPPKHLSKKKVEPQR